MTSTAYLITPADETSGRMKVTSFASAEQAQSAATKNDYVVRDAGDVLWTGNTLVEVFNAVTGKYLKKFESRDIGVRRLMDALPGVAVPAAVTNHEESDMATKEERAAEKAAKEQERAAAKAAKEQEKADAKAAKEQEKAGAKAAKEQEKAAAKAAKEQEKAAKKQAREEAKAARAEAKAASNGTRQRFTNDQRVYLLVKENPKKHGAASKRFELYKDGMTVEEALAAGIQRADLSWDTRKGFIEVAAA